MFIKVNEVVIVNRETTDVKREKSERLPRLGVLVGKCLKEAGIPVAFLSQKPIHPFY